MGDINLKAALGGQIVLTPTNTASNYTVTFPAATGTVALTTGGVLPVSQGGTGLSSLTTGYIPYGNGTGAFSSNSGFTFDGSTLIVPSNISTTSGNFVLGANDTYVGFSANNIKFNNSADRLVFNTGGTERMRLDSVGNLGLGATPSARLQVSRGVGAMPTSLTRANSYLYLGGQDYAGGATGVTSIAFGFTGNTATNAPAYIAYLEQSTVGNTYGNLAFFTRNVTTDTAPTQAMTLDGSSNLVIGGTTANARLDVQGGSLRVNEDGAGTKVITLRSNYASVGPAVNVSTNDPLLLMTNNTERARFNAGAPILCLSGGNTSATGTGIAFPATQSASSDVNTLDDYEEGTWTPNVGGTATYGSRAGYYTKVGNLVYAYCDMPITTIGTGSTQLISGLPFAGTGNQGGGVSYFSGLSSSVYFVAPQVSSASIAFITLTAAATTPNNNAAILTSGSRILVTIVYSTT